MLTMKQLDKLECHLKTMSSPSSKSSATANTNSQGVATLIVMIVVLTIIILFCCFAAPGVRDLCKRYVFRTCVMDDPDRDNASTAGGESATPTIILLPYGRMLVVDRAVFAQLQADHTGIDFMELSANLIRAQRYQTGSTPSILDSETTSKGLSPTSLGFSPPAYEDIFGDKNSDLPPSYSEVSLMFRTHRRMLAEAENIEMCNMDGGNGRGPDDNLSDTVVNNENNLNKELDDQIPRDDNSVHIAIGECDPDASRPNRVISTNDLSNTNDCSVKESSI
ncbi:uncharacterized protein [Tenebrio molitor]|uniref:uncharacterized protein isoform X2 n=2 Tax=Tenebrio molitor TaxID=7067 RepID=UPI00362482F4